MIPLLDWIPQKTLVVALGLSAGITIGSLLLAPMVIARLPADYFREQRRRPPKASYSPHLLLHFTVVSLKNLLGVTLVVAGAAMIVLPGQGLLTMLVGLGLVDFPGRHRLMNSIAGRPVVLGSLNWIRAKMRRTPFLAPATA